jgi:polyisoprenoid-binding protein YceI
MRFAILYLVASAILTPLSQAQAPVYTITQEDSSINFSVKASISIEGKFDKWDASLAFSSPNVETGVLDIKAQAASVDTGSGMKDDKLRGKDFFDANHDPLITFHSTSLYGPDQLPLTYPVPSRYAASPNPTPFI